MSIKKQLQAFLANPSRIKKRSITCSQDVFAEYRDELESMDREVFVVVGLTCRNEVAGETIVSVGSTDSCPVEAREVYRALMRWSRVVRAIVLHNHPSGDCTPSSADVVLTKRLMQCGEILGIALVDHVVIGKGSYTSLRDLDLM